MENRIQMRYHTPTHDLTLIRKSRSSIAIMTLMRVITQVVEPNGNKAPMRHLPWSFVPVRTFFLCRGYVRDVDLLAYTKHVGSASALATGFGSHGSFSVRLQPRFDR
jgi:hypothetical protein